MSLNGSPKLTVDVIIPDLAGKVILIARGHDPFKGDWCLPGGMVDEGETVEDAAMREVREEIGLDVRLDRVFSIRSKPDRDPRGHYISIVFIAHPTDGQPVETAEATAIMRTDEVTRVPMAFDHDLVLQDYWDQHGVPAKVILG